jgi:uncharacterized membrane protein
MAAETPTSAPAPSSEHGVIKWVLRLGLVASSLLMLGGLILRAADHETGSPAAPLFRLLRPGDVGSSTMAIGVLVLALTPIVRVAALVFIWVRERDWRFVAVAAFVMTMLVVSILAGRG